MIKTTIKENIILSTRCENQHCGVYLNYSKEDIITKLVAYHDVRTGIIEEVFMGYIKCPECNKETRVLVE